MESQINLLLFVLSIVSTSGGQQGTRCQVFPSNYTFPTSHTRNAGISGFLKFNNCTNTLPYTTCPHPSVLTDSNTGGDTFSITQYLEWSESNQFSQLLFTFSTEVDLEFGRVYYYFNRPLRNVEGVITLEFLAVPNDFTLGTAATPPNSTSLHIAIVIDLGRNIYIPLSTTTRKLLVNKRGGQDTNFGISEVEFYSVCVTPMTTSSTTPSEVTNPLSGTPQTNTLPPETTATNPPNSSHTDTPTSTLTTETVVENKATSTDSLTIVGYIIASVAMVWMMVLTGVVLVNLYYIMYFYK